MFYLLNLLGSLMFFLLKHPMTMGMMIFIQTILIAIITGKSTMNFWFSYILMLIMIGGLLILFMYMTSIASNEMFSFSYMILLLFISFIIIIIFSKNMDSFLLNYNNYIPYNMNSSFNLNYNLSKFFNYPSMFMSIILMIYLFVTLMMVVKIITIKSGPLRQIN